MSFKAQLTADMDNVFLNTNEFAESITIDGVEAKGFLLEHSGEYEERVTMLKISATHVVTSESVIVIGTKTHGVIGDPFNDGFGSVTVTLGDPL